MHLKSASKDIYNVTKDFNKYYPFAFSINQRILKNKICHVSTKIWSSTTVFNTDNNQKCFLSMISEGSCDTEDWSNDAENSALITGIHYISQYIKIEKLF